MGRKDWRTFLGVFITAGVVAVLKKVGLSDEMAVAAGGLIAGLFGTNIAGIAFEDAGAKLGGAPTASPKP